MIIKKKLAKKMIYNLQGKVFGATFVKKDGSIRNINCRTGVAKHLKGGEKRYDYDNLLCVYDMQSRGYRTINIDTLMQLRTGGNTYHVE